MNFNVLNMKSYRLQILPLDYPLDSKPELDKQSEAILYRMLQIRNQGLLSTVTI
jgi:hypothetical protein